MKARSIVLAVSLGVASLAWADVTEQQLNINQQQLSKRPYATKTTVEKDVTYEGNAVLEETDVKAEKNYKTLQLHMLGKRPYAGKSTD